jgi:hypothetical protein
MHNASMIEKAGSIAFTRERTYRVLSERGEAGLFQCEECCLVSMYYLRLITGNEIWRRF